MPAGAPSHGRHRGAAASLGRPIGRPSGGAVCRMSLGPRSGGPRDAERVRVPLERRPLIAPGAQLSRRWGAPHMPLGRSTAA